MKQLKHWTDEEIRIIREGLKTRLSNSLIAEKLGRSVKSLSSYMWAKKITRYSVVSNISKTPQKVKVEKVQKEKKIKIKITTVKSLIPNPKAENFNDEFELLLYRIRKSIENQNSAYLAGKKIIYIKGNFFKRHSTREYLYFIEKAEKSYFLRTNIFNGFGNFLTGEKSTAEKLDDFRLAYLKEEKTKCHILNLNH